MTRRVDGGVLLCEGHIAIILCRLITRLSRRVSELENRPAPVCDCRTKT